MAAGEPAPSAPPAAFDVSVRLSRRLQLRRVFMQLQSRPGDKTESVSRKQFHDALVSNDALLPFLQATPLLKQLAVRSFISCLSVLMPRLLCPCLFGVILSCV